MKIAVLNEISACTRNKDILNALSPFDFLTVYNVGMTNPNEDTKLTYIQTGIMSAILLNTGICDLAIGGCGTGQGYVNAVMQFPNIFCGLITNPLDAWLFSQINKGNCISLSLNKNYGWAADINLKYIFSEFFKDKAGCGYPLERKESQAQSREILKEISSIAHYDIVDIIKKINKDTLMAISEMKGFMKLLKENAITNEKAKEIYSILNGKA